MSYLSIKTPAPTFKTNRRKCGWGSALTTCDICGKIMCGHNRGVCSKCMRSLVGDRPAHRAIVQPHHLHLKSALRAQALEDRAYNLDQAAKHENGGSK